MMKIVYCILNTWYSGGLTRVIANKANYLVETGHEVIIVTTDQLGKGHFYEMSDKIRFVDLHIHYVGFDDKSLWEKLWRIPERVVWHYNRLKKFLTKENPDIVISTFGRELFVLPFIKDGSMKILEAHSSHFTWLDSRKDKGLFGKFHTWLDARMIRRYDKFVVLTKEDKPDWGELSNIEVIPNANTVESEEQAALDNKVVVAAGRYGYQKNFESLVRTWKRVHQFRPDWQLRIFGGGVPNENLQGLVDASGLTEVVSLRDSTPHIFEEYLQSSIYVLSSRYEGLGMVLLEAQAHGVPLVSYACKCGPRDIISEGENGFLVETGDEQGLAEAIIRLANDENLRKSMGRKAKEHSAMFSEEMIMKRWQMLFSKGVSHSPDNKKDRKMKIIYCIVGTYNSGGMERVLANKANYLLRKGYEVAVVTTDQQFRSPYYAMDPAIDHYDLDINYTEMQESGLLKKIVVYRAKQRLHRQRLTELLIRLKADIVISMFDHESAFLYQIADGSKKMLEAHFSRHKRLQYDRKGLWQKVDRYRSKQDALLAAQYDRFVLLTDEDRAYWGYLPNSSVIPNANSFVPKGAADVVAHKRVIAVGRYDYQKGFDRLIRLWKRVHAQKPDWRLDIFGKGPDEAALREQIQQLNLEGVIRLCPPVNDIQKEYCESAMLVMTSRYEGLPMALLEAQACGLPLVAYACKCGPRDIITDGVNGFLVEEGDENRMLDCLLRLMDDADWRRLMGTKGKSMSANYAEHRVMKQWLDLFKEVTE
ncbi:glycosyltransferase family 4 protein [Sphingobacterium gobiense]|uniref:Glycosyltransferase family 4 protein n=1 Tax=Sphingobacterium gobiense TaxID=1382456 RepID=A0A2S9JT62_9SPHI|nr:glycosyltransferase family 4 protein [Sphingobacterium gobiense]PRD56482.1 hypothetical protein C5749_04365 [Sphingobacterium gobiense]